MERVIMGRRYKVTLFAELSCGGREERGKHHRCELWFGSGACTPYEQHKNERLPVPAMLQSTIPFNLHRLGDEAQHSTKSFAIRCRRCWDRVSLATIENVYYHCCLPIEL